MDLTTTYERLLPPALLDRYEFREVREAAAICHGTNPQEWRDVIEILESFALIDADITEPGKNEGRVAKRLNEAFRERGWREGRHDEVVSSTLTFMPYRAAGEKQPRVVQRDVPQGGYKIDNVKGGIAVDVEWNAKDGNLDRDVGAYARLYDVGMIRAGIIITRTVHDLRELGSRLGRDRFLATTTTTNITKLTPRLTRGSAGGCPVLGVAITARCYEPRGGPQVPLE